MLPSTFFVTPLDFLYKAVLGFSFLSRYNPSIDWVTKAISFQNTDDTNPFPVDLHQPVANPANVVVPAAEHSSYNPCNHLHPQLSSSSRCMRLLSERFPFEPIYTYTSLAQLTPTYVKPNVDIALIGTAAFHRACKQLQHEPIMLRAIHSEVASCVNSAKRRTSPGLDIPPEYKDFADVFDKIASKELPEHRSYDLKIDLLEGAEPPLGCLYPLSPKEIEALRKFLDQQLARGAVQPSNSPHGAPILFVPKKDGSLHLCVDFRGLNNITKKDRYPLPLISDLLDAPKRAKIYTKLNLAHAFHLVRVAEGDEWKTTFRTCYGSYEWKVMPFGLTNGPAVFQCFVNNVFSDMLDICVMVYMDNILIYSDDPETHRKHVRKVLRRLCRHKLYCNPVKCFFWSTMSSTWATFSRLMVLSCPQTKSRPS